MKLRRHHNNKGFRQIKSGTVYKGMKIMARKLGIPFVSKNSIINPKPPNIE